MLLRKKNSTKLQIAFYISILWWVSTTSAVYAISLCSPAINFHMRCPDGELVESWFTNRIPLSDLIFYDCPEAIPIHGELLAMSSDPHMLRINVAPIDRPNQNPFPNPGPCDSIASKETDQFKIAYSTVQPFCGQTLGLFCSHYEVMPFQKMLFDARQGEFWTLFLYTLSGLTGAIVGSLIGFTLYQINKKPIWQKFCRRPKLKRTLYIGTFLFTILITFKELWHLVLILVFYNTLYFPSDSLFFSRIGLLGATIMFVAIQLYLGRKRLLAEPCENRLT